MTNVSLLAEQIQEITAQFQESEAKRIEMERKMEDLLGPTEHDTDVLKDDTSPNNEGDIMTEITSADQIQLESYRAIPEFSGNINEYRSWRNQVGRRMKLIDKFSTHPKYEAALAIIRAKITGAATDVLTNNKTAYNIRAIIRTLDTAYTDRRPLYAIEAEMVAIKQYDKNIHQYYNAINFSLNTVLTKIATTYKNDAEQRSLIAEAQKKAIRTFIVGLKLRMMRNILYGQQPNTLQEAYAIAQTVYYDNENLQLEQCLLPSRPQMQQKAQPRMHQQKMFFANNDRSNQWNQQKNYMKPEPMEIDSSNRSKQVNWRQPAPPQKREYNSSRQQFEQQNKMQRINQLLEATEEEIPDDLISNHSTRTNVSSTFLDE